MNELLLNYAAKKPELYEPGTAKFWDDKHISKGMLAAHLDPVNEPASRNHQFIAKSVDWITGLLPPTEHPSLLDLGCGPGLYTERFADRGYQVTGIDFSTRSLEYARENAAKKQLDITYCYQNYLSIAYEEAFDVITLIYCDFSVFSDSDRKILLRKIYQALKPNGTFIVDVFSAVTYEPGKESHDWFYNETGFWNEKPHLCLNSHYTYDETHTRCNQAVILTEHSVDCYNLWDHTFTIEELKYDLKEAGFRNTEVYGDVTGKKYLPDSEVICAVAVK